MKRFTTALAALLVGVAGSVAPIELLATPAVAAEAGSAPCTQTVGDEA